jgi:hypothetical protein
LRTADTKNRFNGLPMRKKPLKRLAESSFARNTPLKQGVNEIPLDKIFYEIQSEPMKLDRLQNPAANLVGSAALRTKL